MVKGGVPANIPVIQRPDGSFTPVFIFLMIFFLRIIPLQLFSFYILQTSSYNPQAHGMPIGPKYDSISQYPTGVHYQPNNNNNG